MSARQPVFSRERIALLSVCVAAICAILWFATHGSAPAPAPRPVVTDTPAPAVKAPADTAKAASKKRVKKSTKAKTPKGYHPRERDYFKTPEEELTAAPR